MSREKMPEDEKAKPFTSLAFTIHKKIPLTGDKNTRANWSNFFNDKKASKYFKKWVVEAYQKMGYNNVEEFEDIFEEDEDFRIPLNTAIDKMFIKINRQYFPELSLKQNKQEFIKLKLEEEAKKEYDKKRVD